MKIRPRRTNTSPEQIAGKAKSWLTRKARYGSSGSEKTHAQKYLSDRTRLSRLVAILSEEAILSEGQLSDILELDRVAVRKLADDGRMSLLYRPIRGAWAARLMKKIAEEG